MSTHANLFHVGDQDFETKVLQSETPVIVDFWAEWCGPCRNIAPRYEQLSDEYNGKLSFAKMDIDENQMTPGQYGVQAIPTMMVFKGGKAIATIVGPHPSRLKNEIDRVLSEASVA